MSDPPIADQNSKIDNPADSPDLPLLKSWPAVYVFVLLCFLALAIILTAFTRAYR